MAIVVPSRFSLLKMVEDDYQPPKPKETNKTKKADTKSNKKSDDKKTKNVKTNKPKTTNGNNTQTTKKKNQLSPHSDQCEEKTKPIELAEKKFEEDLRQAILLSKLDVEEREKAIEGVLNTDLSTTNDEHFQIKGAGKKQKKKGNVTSVSEPETSEYVNGNDMLEKTYFEDTLLRVRNKNDVNRSVNSSNQKAREPPSNEEIKGSQLQSVLEEKEQEIADLKLEIVSLKDELFKVKSRNKKLCSIIGQGEMKDKAEVLIEVEKLREVQNELTITVGTLHAQLEQERSKGSSATKIDTKFKDKKKKILNDKEA
ncbi:G kinase-anchoring protein 1-like [Arctopsyche grandis]|uniref:G kinase-anchoring protein 1-like n=1 Tax=Arctopsyche grandis TaxID=121162 RepID=UPI00406D6473